MPRATSWRSSPANESDSARPTGTVTSWPDMRRPLYVEPSGTSPTEAASSSVTRTRPMPVSSTKRVSTAPMRTGTVTR